MCRGDAAGSDGAARLGRAAGGASCFGDTVLCSVPWGDAAGAGVPAWQQGVATCRCCPKVSGERKCCVLCYECHCTASTQIFHFLGVWHCHNFPSVGSLKGTGAEPWEKAALHPQRQS